MGLTVAVSNDYVDAQIWHGVPPAVMVPIGDELSYWSLRSVSAYVIVESSYVPNKKRVMFVRVLLALWRLWCASVTRVVPRFEVSSGYMRRLLPIACLSMRAYDLLCASRVRPEPFGSGLTYAERIE